MQRTDDTPTTLFDSYELDFRHTINSIQDGLEGSGKYERGEQRKAILRKVELELDDADDIVSALELEIQGIPQSVRAQYQTRFKQAKADLNRYRKLAREAHALSARSDLIDLRKNFASPSDDPYREGHDRERLMAGIQMLNDGSRRLTDTQRVALEAEEQGADILRNLRQQRETIEGARDTLQRADTNIDRASGTVKKMIYQMHKQRFILSGIGVFFIVLVLFILYFKFVRR